jgi:ribosomal protein RSM22 (predicted rRNA methylase)
LVTELLGAIIIVARRPPTTKFGRAPQPKVGEEFCLLHSKGTVLIIVIRGIQNGFTRIFRAARSGLHHSIIHQSSSLPF